MKSFNNRFSFSLLLVFSTWFLTGCGGESVPQLSAVTGTLLMDGKPLDQVKISFLPNAEKGCSGRISVAETNEKGEFELTYQLPDKSLEGAAVGWHKVCLRDLIPSRSRSIDGDRGGARPAKRISSVYSSSSNTPLEYEVMPDGNVFEIDLKR